jgi:hypothetical protein
MDIGSVKHLLLENKAKLRQSRDGAAVPQNLLRRFWPGIHREDLDRCMEMLEVYASVANYDQSLATDRVTDPMVDGEVRRGQWRHLYCELTKDDEGRLSFDQVLLKVGTGRMLAHASGRGELEDEDTTLYHRHLAKVDAPASSPGLIYNATNSFNDDDGTYDGRIEAMRAKRVDVGLVVEGVTATERRHVEQSANRMTPVVVSEDAAGYVYDASNTLNRFGLYDSQRRVREARGLEVGRLRVGSGVLVATYQDQELNRLAPLAVTTEEAGYVYEAGNRVNEFGLYDVDLRIRTATENSGTMARLKVRDSALSADWEDQARNARAPLQVTESAIGYVYDASNTMNEFGFYDARKTVRAAKSWNAAALRVVSGVLEETSLGVAKNAAAPEAAPAAAAGSIYEIVSRGNDFGLYDIERTRRTAVPALVNTLPVLSSGAETQYELTTLNFSIPAQAVPSAPGWIYDASNSLNQFGVYDSRVRTRKAKAQEVGWTPMEVLPEGGAVYETNLLNQEGVSTLPGNSARSLYQRSVRLNEFSLYDERVEHRQTVSQAFGPFLTARRTGQARLLCGAGPAKRVWIGGAATVRQSIILCRLWVMRCMTVTCMTGSRWRCPWRKNTWRICWFPAG